MRAATRTGARATNGSGEEGGGGGESRSKEQEHEQGRVGGPERKHSHTNIYLEICSDLCIHIC